MGKKKERNWEKKLHIITMAWYRSGIMVWNMCNGLNQLSGKFSVNYISFILYNFAQFLPQRLKWHIIINEKISQNSETSNVRNQW